MDLFFFCNSGAGATMRTVININSGQQQNYQGWFILLLFINCFFFSSIASKIPLAVLSGILIKVGFDILDYKFLKS